MVLFGLPPSNPGPFFWLQEHVVGIVADVALFSIAGCLVSLSRALRQYLAESRPEESSLSDREGAAKLLTRQEKLVELQTTVAETQIRAADAQGQQAKLSARPILLPSLEYNRDKASYELVLRNVGVGVAIQAAWSISPAMEADLNRFIWPRRLNLVSQLRGLVPVPLRPGDEWSRQIAALPLGDYLLLVNYLDVEGNIGQAQLHAFLARGADAQGMRGFAYLPAGEVHHLRATADDPNDLTLTGLYPWWVSNRQAYASAPAPFVVSKSE